MNISKEMSYQRHLDEQNKQIVEHLIYEFKKNNQKHEYSTSLTDIEQIFTSLIAYFTDIIYNFSQKEFDESIKDVKGLPKRVIYDQQVRSEINRLLMEKMDDSVIVMG